MNIYDPPAVNLRQFCRRKTSRFDIFLPWRLDDGRYCATNGSAMIVVEADQYDGVFSARGHYPDVPLVLKPLEQIAEWHDLPKFTWCPKCRNIGMTEEFDDEVGDICETPCTCHVEIGNRTFCRTVSNLLLNLPNCKWGVVVDETTKDTPNEHFAVYFKFDGGVGSIMPVYDSE